ncbi:hypothetical protein BWQ96_06925 [Gracilariopsis chorda]|uniref:Uncharacterized protein n=1 Tax=Gracilariopsis chorda TaxID=448386 RepID=A0A2V3IMH5_9FLOR|nr:hypothetical protein BWQ96_06925 [Gracilariopsis chorda]|eukprot:PXF43286.1 hypothetical protein BWQ96_06925 [Gracilariopsis chorda]
MSGEDFTAQLLKGFEKRATAAEKRVEDRAKRAAAERMRLKREEEEAEKERLAAEVDQLMARARSRAGTKKRRTKKRTASNKNKSANASSSSSATPAKSTNAGAKKKDKHYAAATVNYKAPPKRRIRSAPPKTDAEHGIRCAKGTKEKEDSSPAHV